MKLQPHSLNTIDNILIYLIGDETSYRQKYLFSQSGERQFLSAFEKIPNNTTLTRENVPLILVPGGLPDKILEKLVFREDLDYAEKDSNNLLWLFYKCKPSGLEDSPVALSTYLSLSPERNKQGQLMLKVKAMVSASIGIEIGDMKTDLNLLGQRLLEKSHMCKLIVYALKDGATNINALAFLPLENAGYLFNALMHLAGNINEVQLSELYDLRYARDNIFKSLPFGGSSESVNRKLRLLSDLAYREKQEELIEKLGSPFRGSNIHKYCRIEDH